MNLCNLICLFLTIISLPCYSQNNEVQLQFLSFPKSSELDSVELRAGKDKSIKVNLPTNALSPIYKVKGMKTWQLGRSSVGKDDEFIFKSYGEASSLSSSKQLILVIRKGKKPEDGFKLLVMDNDQSKFRGGQYFFMNFSKKRVGFKIGDKKFILKPRSHRFVSPKPNKVKGKRKYLYTYMYLFKNNKPKPFYESTWRYNKKARSMVFIYHDTYTKQIRTHSIRDYIR